VRAPLSKVERTTPVRLLHLHAAAHAMQGLPGPALLWGCCGGQTGFRHCGSPAMLTRPSPLCARVRPDKDPRALLGHAWLQLQLQNDLHAHIR
jgi:hypothetical protein